LTSLSDASEDFRTLNFGQLFGTQSDDDWAHEVTGLVLGYDQNLILDSIFTKLQNGLFYNSQPFHCPTAVERLGHNCKVEYPVTNQGIMPDSHYIWVQYTASDLNNSFQRQVPAFPVLFFSWTPPDLIIQFHERLRTRKTIPALSKRCKMIPQWILFPQLQEYAVVI
jgi:hypothetical protein